jgi:peptidyl-prolyl cis-trans isomerase D
MAPNPRIDSKKHVARLERERRQTRIIQFIAIGVIASVLLILLYGYLDITFLQKRQPIAEVNGEKISTSEFQARTIIQRNQLINQYQQYSQYQQIFGMDVTSQLDQIKFSLDNASIVGQQVLDSLIEEALIRQESQKRGIEITPSELESFTQAQFQFFPDGTPTPTITPTTVDFSYPTLTVDQLKIVTATPITTEEPTLTPVPTSTLEPTNTPATDATPESTPTPLPTSTPYTLEGFQSGYATAQASIMEAGLNEEQYTVLFKTELYRKKLFEVVTVDTPREEEQIWARHILVDDEDTANQVETRLKDGEDFGQLAAEFSKDPGSRDVGGDLGWFGKGVMVAEFETVAFNLNINQISEPVKSDFGWHIIQVLGRVTVPLTQNAYDQARQTAFSEFLKGLRESSDVKIYEYWTDRIPTTPELGALGQ